MAYSAEKAYRYAVLPLSAFLIFGGAVALSFSLLIPAAIVLPPVESLTTRRLVFGAIGCYLAVLGILLVRRKRIALWGLLAYIVVGTEWQVLVAFYDPVVPWWFALTALPFNLVIASAIYLAVRPAFIIESRPVFQFSLRAFIAFVLLLGFLLGSLGALIRSHYDQKRFEGERPAELLSELWEQAY